MSFTPVRATAVRATLDCAQTWQHAYVVELEAWERTGPTHMNIVAHQDDDLLFMNPDIRNAIAAGHGIVTVYLTAGQASGADNGSGARMCAAEFATSRQQGIKAAYAQMAGVASTSNWTRELIVPDAGVAWPHTVERYTLDADPRIHLIFMNMADGGSEIAGCPYDVWWDAVRRTFEDPSNTFVTTTVVPDCGLYQGYPLTGGTCNGTSNHPNPFVCNSFTACSPQVPYQNYDHSGVTAVLNGLIGMYQPIVIRTLDPQPFSIEGAIDYDNPDHIFTARFVDEVLASYHGPNSSGRYTLTHYKGYTFTAYPRNLGWYDFTTKRDTVMVYKDYDLNFQRYLTNYDSWYGLMYDRYPANTSWLERASDGRLVAITVEDRDLKYWYENSVGGSWAGPVTLPTGGPIAPHVSLVKRPDGKLQIFALQLPLQRETWAYVPPTAPRQDIITAIQNTGSLSFGAWQTIGPIGPGTGERIYGTASASSQQSPSYAPQYSQDGSLSTRWSSVSSDPQWITLDLGAVYPINYVQLRWGTGYGKAYTIQVSNDNATWKNVVSVTNGSGGDQSFNVNALARYVRMYGTKRGNGLGYSLWEFEVWAYGGGQMNGAPTIVFDGNGRVFLFARNSAGHPVYTYSVDGIDWSQWLTLSPSEDIIDGIAAITRDDGKIEVFVTGRSGQIRRYSQFGTFLFTEAATPFYASSAPTVTKNADGRLEIFYREITSSTDSSRYGRVVTAWVDSSGNWVGGDPTGILYGDAGVGPVESMRRDGTGHIMLFERNVNGRLSATWQLAPNSSFSLQWAVLDAPGEAALIQEYPAAATDNLGRAVVVVKASDGRLYMKRETGGVGTFGAWTQIGG